MIASLLIVGTLGVLLAPPSSGPAPRVEDAAIQLRAALRADDRAAVRAMLVAPPAIDAELVEAYLDLLFAAERFGRAIDAAFPHDRVTGPTTSTVAPAPPVVRVVREDEHSADVELSPESPPARFLLIETGWRLDLSSVFPEGEDLARQRAVVVGMTSILDELSGEILAERYVSLVDVRAVMAMRTSDLLANLSQRRSTTRPDQ